MAKILVIVLIAAVIESIGVVMLARGLKEVEGIRKVSVSEVARLVWSVVSNGKVLLGTALEAIFYGALMYMLSQSDVSVVWPLTSVGFIFTTLASQLFLNEKVGVARWGGVVLIAVGVCLISYSKAVEERQHAAQAPPASSAPLGPQ
ncbi:MAG TPA: EamA family transporter [Verrucomicrobiae bacterium]|jgi:drug/metabolite transporter (DMT)-like permease